VGTGLCLPAPLVSGKKIVEDFILLSIVKYRIQKKKSEMVWGKKKKASRDDYIHWKGFIAC